MLVGYTNVSSFTVMLGKWLAKIIFHIYIAYLKSCMGLSISLYILFVIQYHRKHSAATLEMPRLHSAKKVSLFFSGEGCLNVHVHIEYPPTCEPLMMCWETSHQVTCKIFPLKLFLSVKFLMRNERIILIFSFSEENINYFK